MVDQVTEAMKNLKKTLQNGERPADESKIEETQNWKQDGAGLRADAYMTVSQIVQWQGFGFEQFQVKTADGYLLTVHHIKGKTGGAPILMQHGLFSSCETWITNAD